MSESASFPSHLSPSDSLMWHIERDPVLRSPLLAIGLLDRDPDWHAVRDTFERAVERVPRLRQLVVPVECQKSIAARDQRVRGSLPSPPSLLPIDP